MQQELVELVCAEHYYRTVILCDEIQAFTSKVAVPWQRQTPRDAPAASVPGTADSAQAKTTCTATGGAGDLRLDGEVNVCCGRDELEAKMCKFAPAAFALLRRQGDFESSYGHLMLQMQARGKRIRELPIT